MEVKPIPGAGMGFFFGDYMKAVRIQRRRKPKAAVAAKTTKQPERNKEPATRQALVERAYKKVSEKLNSKDESSKGIDDLVKLLKAEKDLGGENDAAEINVTWDTSEGESSSEG